MNVKVSALLSLLPESVAARAREKPYKHVLEGYSPMASHREGFTVGHGLRGSQSFIEGIIEPSARRYDYAVKDGLETLLKWYNNIFIYMNTLYKGYCLCLRLVVQNLERSSYSKTIGRRDRNAKARS